MESRGFNPVRRHGIHHDAENAGKPIGVRPIGGPMDRESQNAGEFHMRKISFVMIALSSIYSSQALSQSTDTRTLEWTQIREISVNRDQSNYGYPILKGFVKNDEALVTVTLTMGEPNSNLRQICYDAIFKAFENATKYELILTVKKGGAIHSAESCTLALKNP